MSKESSEGFSKQIVKMALLRDKWLLHMCWVQALDLQVSWEQLLHTNSPGLFVWDPGKTSLTDHIHKEHCA